MANLSRGLPVGEQSQAANTPREKVAVQFLHTVSASAHGPRRDFVIPMGLKQCSYQCQDLIGSCLRTSGLCPSPQVLFDKMDPSLNLKFVISASLAGQRAPAILFLNLPSRTLQCLVYGHTPPFLTFSCRAGNLKIFMFVRQVLPH